MSRSYAPGSLEHRLLDQDPAAVSEISRWVSRVIGSTSFWSIRQHWEDLHQEILVRLIESLRKGRFRPGGNLKAYIESMTRYTARRLQADRLNRAIELQPEVRPVSGNVPVDDLVVRRQLIRLILDESSEECRQLIREYYLEDHDYRSLAEARQVPLGTIKSRLSRCLENIRRRMARLSGGGPGFGLHSATPGRSR